MSKSKNLLELRENKNISCIGNVVRLISESEGTGRYFFPTIIEKGNKGEVSVKITKGVVPRVFGVLAFSKISENLKK